MILAHKSRPPSIRSQMLLKPKSQPGSQPIPKSSLTRPLLMRRRQPSGELLKLPLLKINSTPLLKFKESRNTMWPLSRQTPRPKKMLWPPTMPIMLQS